MSMRPFQVHNKDLKFALWTVRKKKGNAMNNTHIKSSSDYAFNYTEHLVTKKADSKTIIQRIAIILVGLILMGVLVFLMFGPIKVPQIGAVALLLIGYVCKVLWSYTKIEYEYLIVSGEMTMDIIYASKKRRQIAEFKVPVAEAILPYADAKLDGVKVTYGVSSPSDEDAYCAIYQNDNGAREALVFNADERALKMLHYYNKATVIKK